MPSFWRERYLLIYNSVVFNRPTLYLRAFNRTVNIILNVEEFPPTTTTDNNLFHQQFNIKLLLLLFCFYCNKRYSTFNLCIVSHGDL